MEKKNQFKDDLRRLCDTRSKLLNETKKVPETQKELANLSVYGVINNQQTKGV